MTEPIEDVTHRPPPHLRVQEEFDLPTGEHAATAADDESTYLAVEVAGRAGPCWVCAPATTRALDCVRCGRTDAWVVIHHSATGTVQLWRPGGRGWSESVVLCSQLPARETLAAA
jgi:hypothetical protein